jgi:Flp pilus assembly protein TadG
MTNAPTPERPAPDRGSASVSIAIIFPAIALLFLALAQAVMLAAAHDVAVGSAEEGLRVARAHNSTLARGKNAAIVFAHHEPVLLAPHVTASGTTTITVTVHGSAPSLLPGVHLSTSGTAAGARERFTIEPAGSGVPKCPLT